MIEIHVRPNGTLHLDPAPSTVSPSPAETRLVQAFVDDWRGGLFALSAVIGDLSDLSLSARFWRGIGDELLTRLCHQPNGIDTAAAATVPPPSATVFDGWVSSAPPMVGGEYLTADRLDNIWRALVEWTRAAIVEADGLEPFLANQAPAWRRVGRVTFHLAENKRGATRPFAFLATFTTGLAVGGKDKHLPLRQAFDLYSGEGNKTALIKLLTPVKEAAGRLDWVRDLVDSGAVYRPAAWTVEQAHRLLTSVAELEEAGLVVRIPDWWHDQPRPQVQVTVGRAGASLLNAQALLDIDVGVMLGDDRLTPSELRRLLAGDDGLVLLKGRWIEVDRSKLQTVLDHWHGVENSAEAGELSLHQGLRLLAGASAELHPADDDSLRDWSRVVADKGLQDLLHRLRNPDGKDGPRLNADLTATLRPYQHEGVAWLHLLTGLGLGACLADDMGLGKTIQVLALLSTRKRKRGDNPSLLIVPASLLGNWRAEADRFAPGLKLLFLHAAQTDRATLTTIAADPGTHFAGVDLVITTYAMAHRLDWLADRTWHLVILDEAQAIKNSRTRQSRAAQRLHGTSRIALTGTPVENSLGDLWSLFDFLNPGLLGSVKVFKDFVKGMEKSEHGGFEPLRRLVSPYILRRLKTDRTVISDLPEKTETVCYCALTRPQVKLYAGVVDSLAKGLADTSGGIERRGLVLQALMRFKQVCNHPSQLTGDGRYEVKQSGKFQRLGEICTELSQRQERALVFTQYREIMPALEDHLAQVFGRPGLTLHGGTNVRRRQALVEQFQADDGPPFFIISLKAGGTGLNLTVACHVIHFDRWWNPAVENQATDRAFRIGQVHNVLVHKFVTSGTIEERIDEMIHQKKDLAEQVLGGESVKLTELSDEDLMDLVRLDVTRASI
jgi:SNF2 family DNA or RNA helicase